VSLYRDRGVVLRTVKLGEADRIVSLLTPAHGKVRAVAKGVRRTKSRFGGRLEPLSHVELMCWQGRELDVVTQVEVIDSFRPVRQDLARTAKAAAMLEVADQASQERQAAPELYAVLVGALRTLAARDSPLLLAGYLLKVLALEGASPVLEHCARCGAGGELVAFDLAEGGALCRSCRRGAAVGPEALGLMRQILGGELARALAQPAGPAAEQVESLAVAAVEAHLERGLRAVRSLRSLRQVTG